MREVMEARFFCCFHKSDENTVFCLTFDWENFKQVLNMVYVILTIKFF